MGENNLTTAEFARNDSEAYEFARALIYEAGEQFLTSLANPYKTRWKEDNTPVTDIDENIQGFIMQRIQAQHPGDGLLAEEKGGKIEGTSGRKWVVDPTDGTQSLDFVPTATICITRVDAYGQPDFSHIYNPKTDELFTAQRGKSAELIRGDKKMQLEVSDRSTLTGSYLFLTSRIQIAGRASNGTLYDKFETQGAKIFNTRSLAYRCCMVAAGKAVGAILGVKTPFEAASVKLIVEGAGGKVTDLFGETPGRFDEEINGLVVSNGVMHDQFLEALRPAS